MRSAAYNYSLSPTGTLVSAALLYVLPRQPSPQSLGGELMPACEMAAATRSVFVCRSSVMNRPSEATDQLAVQSGDWGDVFAMSGISGASGRIGAKAVRISGVD